MAPSSSNNKIQRTTHAPPPAGLPMFARARPEDVTFFGETNYSAALEEKKYIFGIKRSDRLRHMYIVGKSGVGKSKLLEIMMRQDIRYGHGVCLVDPRGDLIEELLDSIPEERARDVCLIDPRDTSFPISFNPLADVEDDFKHQFTQSFVEVMEKQFDANWTPRLEHVFRFTVLALLDYPEATMRGIISMVTNKAYREEVVPYIQDELVQRFWMHDFDDWVDRFETEAVIPLVNKLGQFFSDPMLRNIFDQRETKISFEELIENKAIVLINLAKGRIGESNARLLGGLLMTKIKIAGSKRRSKKDFMVPDFYIYVDEFHSLVTENFENTLSESRKYGVSFTLSHQYLGQLSHRAHQAVLGTIGTIIAFRVGGEDAIQLEPEFAPVFGVKDLINLSTSEFYIKMVIDGETDDPFSARTLSVNPPQYATSRKAIIEASRAKYALRLE